MRLELALVLMIVVSASTAVDAAVQAFNGVLAEKAFTKAHLRSPWYLKLRLKGESLQFQVSGYEIGDRRIKALAEQLVVGASVSLSCQPKARFPEVCELYSLRLGDRVWFDTKVVEAGQRQSHRINRIYGIVSLVLLVLVVIYLTLRRGRS